MSALDSVRGVARDLRESGVPSPRVDAEFLVGHVLGLSRSELYATDRELTEIELTRLRELVERRRAREPLAYVLGEWGFRRLTLEVDRRVLIPRPETEVLVERCLERVRGLAEPRILDVGAGSGAIALAIADEHPGARILAVERSVNALAVARRNLRRAGVDGRVELRRADLLAEIAGPFDLVVSNPPYVSPEEYESLQPEIRLYEPREALVGVGVGAEIAREARRVLERGGWLALECGDGQAGDLAAELEGLGYRDVRKTRDLAGRDRIVEGRWA
ncbi:MAG TPA: peptide chain release factor N(5)-glutamine methyltransferase [Gaiellaceae bacterium]|nr:peptide chain release factor N(5)-glutamine methyltransferase [Gaiellaceae bacterium]